MIRRRATVHPMVIRSQYKFIVYACIIRRVCVGHSFLKAKQSRDGSMKYTLLKIYDFDLYHYNAVSQKKIIVP